jgi:hypothetical protein
MYKAIPHLFVSLPSTGTLQLEWRWDGPGEPAPAADHRIEMPLRLLGLPDDLRELDEDPDPALLSELVSQVVPRTLPSTFLSIDSAAPWLAALPWEDAMPKIEVKRTSYFRLPPAMRHFEHAAVVTSSGDFPPARLRAALNAESWRFVTHLTLDQWHELAGRQLALYQPRMRRAPRFDSSGIPEERVTAPISNPVLRWSLGALNAPADSVQFVAPLLRSGSEPVIALRNDNTTELAAGPELALFAAHAGAWLVLITAPSASDMPLARMLAHRINTCGPLDCRVASPGTGRPVSYTSPLGDEDAASRFLDRYTLTQFTAQVSSPWLKPAQRLIERYAAECFEHQTHREMENREPGEAWRGMLRGILDAREEFVSGFGAEVPR